MKRPSLGAFLREVFSQWQEDRALSHGAALAYYTLFSLAPLLVLVIAVVGLVFGPAAAEGEVVGRIQDLMGPDGAKVIQDMILRASEPKSGVLATVISLATMLLGATGIFGQLQTTLNDIFEAAPSRRHGMWGVLRTRIIHFGMILGLGSLLWISLFLSAALAAVGGRVVQYLPVLGPLLRPANAALAFVIVTTFFALIYKALPDVRMHWRDVLLGAFFTALLFTLGRSLIGLYLGRAGATSIYGAAGSLVLVLLWVYYSAQILLLGAEFTEVYSRFYGSRRPPEPVQERF